MELVFHKASFSGIFALGLPNPSNLPRHKISVSHLYRDPLTQRSTPLCLYIRIRFGGGPGIAGLVGTRL